VGKCHLLFAHSYSFAAEVAVKILNPIHRSHEPDASAWRLIYQPQGASPRFPKLFLLTIGIVLFQFSPSLAAAANPTPLNVMTFNIRYGTAPDGENAWPKRREMVLEELKTEKPQILGLQECLRDQLDTILEKFPQLSAVGVGRTEDGGGEYSPILYDRTRFDLLAAETFWLSDTPTVRGSTSWGNNLTRICTWARLLERDTNRVIVVMNTHWDHQSQPAREASGKFMAKRAAEFDPDEPLILMGDFNVGPDGPAREPLTKAGLRDSFVDLYPEQANKGTFHAFTGKATSDKIDAILVSKQWKVTAAEIIHKEQNGVFLSDHDPVTAELVLEAEK
jgi:endonuclease/exonuclease/phosphatase family metal-dependent hydrolase